MSGLLETLLWFPPPLRVNSSLLMLRVLLWLELFHPLIHSTTPSQSLSCPLGRSVKMGKFWIYAVQFTSQ